MKCLFTLEWLNDKIQSGITSMNWSVVGNSLGVVWPYFEW